ncbi:MAG: ATP-dependent zinc metalloprotease FtsH [Candidatus Parcubacteria bacterium]|nr:ATP-dependent zinc metalloprotease FtsH [Candidatus Parcubacteria bacterium]
MPVDVAGVEEAVVDVAEVVDFLHNPDPYTALGAKIPRGVILTGPPGCGKTLLARAIAGEAGVPFFQVSGSEFVEMYVGVGAARVRDTFEQAQKVAPSIIFIDEIDAIGRSRSSGHGNNNDEREQTLNEILTKMDGFGEMNVPVIVLAATNRDDILDAALMRAGRFDRKVNIHLPDLKGREQIIKVHTAKKPLEEGTNLLEVVRGMTGVSGADLANLANEAALIAVRRKGDTIVANDFELAKDKVTMGAKSGLKMKEHDKRNTAYHEAGHAIVGYLQENFDQCTKVSILPRANALGITQFTPEEDKVSMTKAQIFSTIKMAYGGRAAEEIIGGADNITTGASNDIQRITSMLTSCIMQWGLSDSVGQLAYASEYGDHLAHSVQRLPYSEKTAQMMDEEKQALSQKLYSETKKLLLDNRSKMDAMAHALLKWETIEVEQIEAIMEGREPPTPKWFIEPTAPVVLSKE